MSLPPIGDDPPHPDDKREDQLPPPQLVEEAQKQQDQEQREEQQVAIALHDAIQQIAAEPEQQQHLQQQQQQQPESELHQLSQQPHERQALQPQLPTADLDESTTAAWAMLQITDFPEGTSFKQVSKEIRSQAIGASVNQVLQFAALTFCVSAVGRNYDTETLAAMGVAISTFNLFALSVSVGFCAALDTVAAQAYGRSKTSREVGEYTQLAIGVALVLCTFFSLFFLLFGEQSVALIFGAQYAPTAGIYLRAAIPQIFVYSLLNCLVKSLQSQHLARVPMLASMISSVFTFCSSLVFIRPTVCHAGTGVALTMTLSSLIQLIANVLLSPSNALFKTVPWRIDAVEHWQRVFARERVTSYLELAWQSYLSVAAEWLAFDLISVLVAKLGSVQLACFSIFFNCATFVWASFSGGFAVAASSHVGRLLGERKPRIALVYGRTCLVWAAIGALLLSLIIAVFDRHVAYIYTSDPELVAEFCSVIVPYLFLWTLFDGQQYSVQGVFRGAGRQEETPIPVLASLYFVGLPCAYLFPKALDSNSKYKLHATIVGFLCGLAIEIPLLFLRMRHWDWNAIADKASRVAAEEAEREKNNEVEIAEHETTQATEMHENNAEAAVTVAEAQNEQKAESGVHGVDGTQPQQQDVPHEKHHHHAHHHHQPPLHTVSVQAAAAAMMADEELDDWL